MIAYTSAVWEQTPAETTKTASKKKKRTRKEQEQEKREKKNLKTSHAWETLLDSHFIPRPHTPLIASSHGCGNRAQHTKNSNLSPFLRQHTLTAVTQTRLPLLDRIPLGLGKSVHRFLYQQRPIPSAAAHTNHVSSTLIYTRHKLHALCATFADRGRQQCTANPPPPSREKTTTIPRAGTKQARIWSSPSPPLGLHVGAAGALLVSLVPRLELTQSFFGLPPLQLLAQDSLPVLSFSLSFTDSFSGSCTFTFSSSFSFSFPFCMQICLH